MDLQECTTSQIKMQAYIASVEVGKKYYQEKDSIIVNFSGTNFRNEKIVNPEFLEFKDEFLISLKDIKKQISELTFQSDSIVFSGGEPCLQRMALLELARHSKKEGLRNIIETNCTKQASINSLLRENLADVLVLKMDAPLNEPIFQRISKSGTFFKPCKEVIEEILKSINIISRHKEKLFVEIRTVLLDSIVYRQEDIKTIGDIVQKLSCHWKIIAENATESLLVTVKNACKNINVEIVK